MPDFIKNNYFTMKKRKASRKAKLKSPYNNKAISPKNNKEGKVISSIKKYTSWITDVFAFFVTLQDYYHKLKPVLMAIRAYFF